jgi:hypothetical protein
MIFTGKWIANHDVSINRKTNRNPKRNSRLRHLPDNRRCSNHVDSAKALEANALAKETEKQLKGSGARRRSTSKIITEINVTVFEMHKAVKYV